MLLTDCAETVSNREAQPILFGLFADGSGEARFARLRGAAFGTGSGSEALPRFSPSRDWYGRWAVRPLHGRLVQEADRGERGVCPDDIVSLGAGRRAHRS